MSESAEVEISGFKFSPATLTVKSGQTIKVVNRDSVGHTMTADDGTSFESGLLGKDQSGTITAPSKPGSYGFHCSPHPYMKGTLVVE
ncbi:cupredoxin family copper-binding protein [Candidatus Collierbacteria bacterium]|nr:cupredoxin family copper-binding protein [Candidatus Collierbacteria bacterium]